MAPGNWDSVYIYYISGTGNAMLSSGWIADEALKRGMKAIIGDISRPGMLQFPSANEKPLIGFAYPTHGFNAAPIMVRFIAGFPGRIGREVFLLNTRGGLKLSKLFMPGLSGVALLLPAFLLILKGYKCVGLRPVDMPSNWMSLHPGLKEKIVESIVFHCEGIVRRFSNKILDGGFTYRGLASLPLDIAISPIALAYYIGGRFFLAKTFIASCKCNNCGLCIRECPTSSIRMVDNRPYWTLTCESCMRCLNHCPERAIEAAHGMAIIFWLIFTTVNTWIFTLLLQATGIDSRAWYWWLFTHLAAIGGMIGITAMLYWILHFMMRWKAIRYIAAYSSLTAFRFWRRYNYSKHSKTKEGMLK